MSFLGDLFQGLQELLAFALETFYDLVPSFGISIIMLTLTINFILFPLTLRQTRATRAFQEIQKEYKDDPETMQKELMRAQREAGATPGGCLLPILVQSPIWFALFRVLRNISWTANGQLAEFDAEPILHAGTTLRQAVEANNIDFLGMSLGLNMSEGITAGGLSALPYIGMLVLMVASARPAWPDQEDRPHPAAATAAADPTAHHPRAPVVHRRDLLGVPGRPGPLLGDLEPLPGRTAICTLCHRWTPQSPVE